MKNYKYEIIILSIMKSQEFGKKQNNRKLKTREENPRTCVDLTPEVGAILDDVVLLKKRYDNYSAAIRFAIRNTFGEQGTVKA
jgi:hypothetical protein